MDASGIIDPHLKPRIEQQFYFRRLQAVRAGTAVGRKRQPVLDQEIVVANDLSKCSGPIGPSGSVGPFFAFGTVAAHDRVEHISAPISIASAMWSSPMLFA